MQQSTIRTIIKLLTLWVPVVVFGACETDITRTRSGEEEMPAGGLRHQDAASESQSATSLNCYFIRYTEEGTDTVDSYHGYVYEMPEKLTAGGQVVDFEWPGPNYVTDDLVRHTCESNPHVYLQLYSPSNVQEAYSLETYVENRPALTRLIRELPGQR